VEVFTMYTHQSWQAFVRNVRMCYMVMTTATIILKMTVVCIVFGMAVHQPSVKNNICASCAEGYFYGNKTFLNN